MADRPMNRGRKARKKVCGFCVELTVAIKRARHLALLPYTAD